MAGPLIETELHVSRRRRGLAARLRLAERLNRAEESSPALVSAPARIRKTTLLTEWPAAAVPVPVRRVAWPSLDKWDNDPYTRPALWRRWKEPPWHAHDLSAPLTRLSSMPRPGRHPSTSAP
jgi:hypothetical protein